LYQRLLELEQKFFSAAFISDEKWLDSVLHDKFLECGKSGTFSRKADTVEALLSCQGDRPITIRQFSCEQLAEDCWMVHYITGSDEDACFRTSIWVRDGGALQLRFHQASVLKRNAGI